MFNKLNLFLSLLFPIPLDVAVFISDELFQTRLFEVLMLIVYLQHVLIGYAFDLRLDGYRGEWVGMPFDIPVLAATLILDYLLVAMIIYGMLTLFAKFGYPLLRSFARKNNYK